jgi:hypothetical protein
MIIWPFQIHGPRWKCGVVLLQGFDILFATVKSVSGTRDIWNRQRLAPRARWPQFTVVAVRSPGAPAIFSGVPLLAGTMLNEMTHGINPPEYEEMTMDDVLRRARVRFKDRKEVIIAAYQ